MLGPSFPQAGQPDMVLAGQKDNVYVAQVRDRVSQVVESLLGARVLTMFAPEINLISEVCYYGLTGVYGKRGRGVPGARPRSPRRPH